ncbi:MAG: DUF819 family protein [Verrucomicrobiales bacterium]|nr:DUF819 family protein [Verrucomicrobiales bacterium]
MATNRFVLITALALAVATAFPRWLSTIRGADEIGSFILYLFLFGIGLPADLSAVVRGGPALFLLCVIICATNIGVTLALGRWLRWPLEELVLSVNATLGGPPTAAAMAVSKGWSRLVLPGILIGLWGYTIGTPLGLLVTATLDRWFAQP